MTLAGRIDGRYRFGTIGLGLAITTLDKDPEDQRKEIMDRCWRDFETGWIALDEAIRRHTAAFHMERGREYANSPRRGKCGDRRSAERVGHQRNRKNTGLAPAPVAAISDGSRKTVASSSGPP
jgi:hypothetical protein